MSPKASDFRQLRPDLADRMADLQKDRTPLSLFLDQVDDPRNIGSVFRLADAARLREVIIRGIPPDWEPSKKVRRTARSTLTYVPFRTLQTTDDWRFLEEEYQILLLEKTETSTSLWDFQPQPDKAYLLVLGNEEAGVSPELLAAGYPALHIPMLGINSSMNVAHAGSIGIYSILEKMYGKDG
jgi:tRNA G18 (ribose-2'-O)-methylase SpoU